MSYDGGLEIKIMNPKLGEILDEFEDKGYFPEGWVKRWRNRPAENDNGKIINPKVKYTLYYTDYDCAEVSGCPQNMKELSQYIFDLISAYEEDISWTQEQEIIERISEEDVVNDYSLVSWKWFLSDYDSAINGGDSIRVFEYER